MVRVVLGVAIISVFTNGVQYFALDRCKTTHTAYVAKADAFFELQNEKVIEQKQRTEKNLNDLRGRYEADITSINDGYNDGLRGDSADNTGEMSTIPDAAGLATRKALEICENNYNYLMRSWLDNCLVFGCD